VTNRSRNQGELEAEIMAVLWSSQSQGKAQLSSQEVAEKLNPERALAITTVLTVLSRLVDKDLVVRVPGPGRSLLFSAAQTREQHDASLLLRVFESSDNPLLAFSHFAKSLPQDQLDKLRQSLQSE
jgi:predicted transcriptional regulator